MVTLQLEQSSFFFRAIIVATVVVGTGCMPRQAAVVAPVPDALGAASVLQDQTGLESPIRILFVWELNDAGVGVKGRGVARVAPPYRARLDLFLDNGELVIKAALVDGEFPQELQTISCRLRTSCGVHSEYFDRNQALNC